MEDLLPQTCQILTQTEVSDQWNPVTVVLSVLFDNVACRLDTTMMMRGVTPLSVPNEVGMPNRTGGILFLTGNYGVGKARTFDEKNIIRLEGYDYEILTIHDVWADDYLHHYELEIFRGVTR